MLFNFFNMKRKNQTKLSEAIEFFFYSLGLHNFIFQFEIKEVWKEIANHVLLYNTSKIIVKKKTVTIYLNSMLLTVDCNYKKNKIQSEINKKLKKNQIENLEFKFLIKN